MIKKSGAKCDRQEGFNKAQPLKNTPYTLREVITYFVVAVVMLALAACVQSSLIAQHAPGVSYVTSALHPAGPWGAPLGHWGGHAAVDHSAWGGPFGGHAAVDHGAWGGPWAGPGLWGGHGVWGGHAIPGISLAQGPGAAHAGLGLAHGAHGHGVYVAKTRGAVHTAPLAGHIASATSINVAPAPGTH